MTDLVEPRGPGDGADDLGGRLPPENDFLLDDTGLRLLRLRLPYEVDGDSDRPE